MVLILQASTFMLSARFERGWLSGAPDCSRPQLCVGSEPTDPAPPLELQNAPHPLPNNQPPASAYTVRGQRTTWVSLGLSGKHCEPDINSLPAATAPCTPLCLLPCWTCGPFGNPSWPLPTPLLPDRPSADVCFLTSLLNQLFGEGRNGGDPGTEIGGLYLGMGSLGEADPKPPI